MPAASQNHPENIQNHFKITPNEHFERVVMDVIQPKTIRRPQKNKAKTVSTQIKPTIH